MRIGLARLVVDAVADITGLEEEIASAVDHSLVRQDVFHFAHRHLAYAWPQVIMVAHMPSRSDGNFGDPHFVLPFELRQVSPVDGRLIKYLCCPPAGVNFQGLIRVSRYEYTSRKEAQRHLAEFGNHRFSFLFGPPALDLPL